MNSVLQKMRIKAPHVLYVMNAPPGYEKSLGKLPAGIRITTDPRTEYNSVHWFAVTRADVDKLTPKVMKLMKPGVMALCYYPKGTSKIQTDLTRDKGWDSLISREGLKWLTLISFDDTWSAFSFRLQNADDKKKEAKPVEREIFKYADSATRTITLPDDVGKALRQNKEAKTFFDSLAFSHKREYIEWIVTAKREETRNKRMEGMIKLLTGRKKLR